MILWRRLAMAALLGFGTMLGTAAMAQTVVTTDHVRAELVAHAPEGIEPGKPVWLGLQLTHQPEWHTYWKNPGDSGLPTQLEWKLPAGVTAAEIGWPVPKKIFVGTLLANYGYEDTVLLTVPLTIAPEFRPSLLGNALQIGLHAKWLVCRKECIPQEGTFELKVPARGATALHGTDFAASFAAQPKTLPRQGTARIDGGHLAIEVPGLPAQVRGHQIEFLPETPELLQTAGPWTQSWQGSIWTAKVPLSEQRTQSPPVLPVVLAADGKGWSVDVRVPGQWPAAVPSAGVPAALQEALRRNAAETPAPVAPMGLAAAVLNAFLAGLILNLMPCVFPLLAVRAMRGGHSVGRVSATEAAAFAIGVIASFLAFGAALMSMRAAGELVSWGSQLQSPAVVAALAAFLTLVGLKLAGVFRLAHVMPARWLTALEHHPEWLAFAFGIVCALAALPWTTPFMPASLGLAVGLRRAEGLLVFASLGIGMCLPYVVVRTVPAVQRALTLQGPWEVTVSRLMAFPVFGTVAWLLWVLGQQSGIDGLASLLALLVALAMAVWALTLPGKSRRTVGVVAFAILVVFAWGLLPSVLRAQ